MSTTPTVNILKKIAKVADGVMATTLQKDERNKHGGYNYASVDKFYELVQPLMIEAKTLCQPVEQYRMMEDYGGKTIAIVGYAFRWIDLETGDIWFDPQETKEIRLHFTGPQTYGAAQSYVHKFYLRGFFAIPTGDKDADADKPLDTDDSDFMSDAPAKTAPAKKAPAKTPAKAPPTKTAPTQEPAQEPARQESENPAPPEAQSPAPAASPAPTSPPVTSRGPVITFTINGQPTPLRIPEIWGKLEPELGDLFPGDRPEWERRNAQAMAELHNLNKTVWLKVKKALSGPGPGNA